MQVYIPKLDVGSRHFDIVEDVDWWAPYRGKYPDPTPLEFNLIRRFLCKFAFEDDDFVEDDDDQRWRELKNRVGCPNLRPLLLKFLRQVRETKGYDVDFEGSISEFNDVFFPRRLDEKKFYDEAMAATKFAMGKINLLGGKSYEVVSVDKVVWTNTKLLLLTFTAKEIVDGALETVEAMVYSNSKSTSSFKLKEWKFKPALMSNFETISNM